LKPINSIIIYYKTKYVENVAKDPKLSVLIIIV